MLQAAFGTQHGKLPVVRRVLLHAGIDVVPIDLDTDQFGTFSGTTPRRGTQLETVIAKAQASAERANLAAGIGSEGSFAPDPITGLVPVGIELVALVDSARRHPIVGRHASYDTNFASRHVSNITDALAFAHHVGAPDHGLIAVVNDEIIEVSNFTEQIPAALSRSDTGDIRLDTDMRAHRNPTRMRAIELATLQLAALLAVACDTCGEAGAAHIEPQPGLPCEACGTPTQRIRVIHACCSWCDAAMILPPDHGLLAADPAECPRCNP